MNDLALFTPKVLLNGGVANEEGQWMGVILAELKIEHIFLCPLILHLKA